MSRARNIADLITSGGSGLATYESIGNLPSSGTTGDLAYVTDNQKMYLWNGTVWFHILTAETPNTAPFITTQPKFGYSLATDGTPLVLTLNATDPEGTAITWNYTVTGGTLGNTATISVNNNQFTITPSTNTADAGEFTLTFTASDGLHVANSNPTYFSLFFSYDWIYGTMTVEDSIANPAFSTIVSGADSSTLRFGNCIKFMRPNELLISSPGVTGGTRTGAIWIYDTSTVPAVCIAHYTKVGNTTSGAFLGLSVDFNDDWIIASTDEASTNNNAQVLWFKRNSDGTWPVDANGRLTVYQETTGEANLSLFGTSSVKNVSMDKNNNRCVIGNGFGGDMWIYEYNTLTTQWEQVFFTDAASSNLYSSMLDDYAVLVSSSSNPVLLFKRSPEGIWNAVNQYYNYAGRAFAKLLSYNGDHYIVLIGSARSTTTESYNVEVLKIDELSSNISQLINSTQTGATTLDTTVTEVVNTENVTNMDYADAYISGSIVHVIVGRSSSSADDVRYLQFNLTTNTIQNNLARSAGLLTGAGGADIIHTVAFDRYTGKLAVAQTTYNTGVADAGKVWILR